MSRYSTTTNLVLSPATLAIHADDHLASTTDVAPPIHVSTTFRYPQSPENLVPAAERNDAGLLPFELEKGERKKNDGPQHIYSRISTPSTTRLEHILSQLLDGHATTYSSGLSAFHALLVRVNPKRLVVVGGGCYHGCKGVANMFSRLTGMEVVVGVDMSAPEFLPGDLIHLETPLNPTGEATNIEAISTKAHLSSALLSIDSTFAPPPLQNPFLHGADFVLHSMTKYLGGHSDLLGGVLVTRDAEVAWELKRERVYLGSVMGGLEGWLGLRSVRTLEMRVERQSRNAERIVEWISSSILNNTTTTTTTTETETTTTALKKVISKITHASLQPHSNWLQKQMPKGFGPVFALHTHTESQARCLPGKLGLFQHATSLGGVESLIEWRAMTDDACDRRLLRISVGVEAWEDLKWDLERGVREVWEEVGGGEED